MSQTGEAFGGMVDSAMGPGGSAVDQELGMEIPEEVLVEMIEELPEELQELIAEGVGEIDHDANLADLMSDSDLGSLSSDLLSQVQDDIESRSEWEEALSKGLDLLGISNEERDDPFAGASGVTHPLISESVTQFQAQAYKELFPASGPIRTNVAGTESPEVMAQAQRVKDFMNYYVSEVMEEYEQDADQMLFYLPLSGSTFKKVYFDPTRQRAVSKFVPAEDVIVPYAATDIRTSERITHVVHMSENDVTKMQIAGIYREADISAGSRDMDEIDDAKAEIQGIRPSHQDDVYTLYEIHTYLDLEGFEDTDDDGEPTGLKLPYIVTIDKNSGEILSILRNYEEQDPMQKPIQHFVHYKFLPGLGFYGFGLVHMIGGLARASTSILRQLIDAGTLANLPAGFKARGVRIRNDDEPLQPGEFRDIDVPGGDIRNAIVPMVYKEPSGTLAQLLGVLVDSGRRYASIADAKIADGNAQNAPVGTTVALLERGSRVMSAIHKRLHRSLKQEIRILSSIIADTVEAYPYATDVPPQQIQADFDGRVDILPVSDPNIFSSAQRHALAQTQLQMASQNPEIHNLREAYRRMYEALEVKNIDAILKPEPQPAPLDSASELAMVFSGKGMLVRPFPGQNHTAHIQAYLSVLQTELGKNPSMQQPLFSLTMSRISMIAQEEAQAQVAAMQQQAMMSGIPFQPDPQAIQAQIEARTSELSSQIIPMMAPRPQQDPLVGIRQAEVQLQAAEQQRKVQKDQIDAMLEAQRQQMTQDLAQERLRATLDIAEERNNVNRERIETQEDIAVMREMGKQRQS